MIALPLSIVCATFLVICFKYYERFGIVTLHAIVFNYILCVATGIMMTGDLPDSSVFHKAWFPVAAILGCSFFCIFNLMAFVARNIGLNACAFAGATLMVLQFAFVAPGLLFDMVQGGRKSAIRIGALAMSLEHHAGIQVDDAVGAIKRSVM